MLGLGGSWKLDNGQVGEDFSLSSSSGWPSSLSGTGRAVSPLSSVPGSELPADLTALSSIESILLL